MKKAALACMLIAAVFLTSSCADYRELNNMSIVAGLGVTLDSAEEYTIFSEITNVQNSDTNTWKSALVEGTGVTFTDALRNTMRSLGSELYFGHMQLVIVDERTARNGIDCVTSYLNQQNDVRLSLNILVSKDEDVAKYYSTESLTQPFKAYEMSQIINANHKLSKVPRTSLLDFRNEILEEGVEGYLPIVQIVTENEKELLEIGGTAIFKNTQMVGEIDAVASKYLLMAKNQARYGIINTHLPEGDAISFELYESRARFTSVTDEEAHLHFDLKVSAVELPDSFDILSYEKREMLTDAAEREVIGQMQAVFEQLQKVYEVDTLGVGKTLHQKNPALWAQVKDAWYDGVYQNMQLTVTADAELRESGRHISSPAMKD